MNTAEKLLTWTKTASRTYPHTAIQINNNETIAIILRKASHEKEQNHCNQRKERFPEDVATTIREIMKVK